MHTLNKSHNNDNPAGTIEYLDKNDITSKNIQTSMSPNQLGILEIIDICKLRGNEPDKVDFLCTVPENISLGLELSSTLQERVKDIATEIVNRLDKAGYKVTHA